MAYNFDTSFIPQQPLLKIEGMKNRQEPVNLALVVALIVLVTTVAVAVGTYFYKKHSDREVLAKETELEEAEKDLAFDDIRLYKRIDTRLSIAKQLLDQHTVFSVILDLLEESAAQNIGLTSLAYAKDNGKDYSLTLSGQGTSYGAVYAQSQAWKDMDPLVKQIEIASVSLEEESGIVSFSARLLINGDYTQYSRLLEAERRIEEGASSLQSAPINLDEIEPINPPTP